MVLVGMETSSCSENQDVSDKESSKMKEHEGMYLRSHLVEDIDEAEEKDSSNALVPRITSDDLEKGVEEIRKGILKHARTYSNKHVDFNLKIEYVPYDETKDVCIEIQIVEKMPKKIVSYAALIAEERAREEAERKTKEEAEKLSKENKKKSPNRKNKVKPPKNMEKDMKQENETGDINLNEDSGEGSNDEDGFMADSEENEEIPTHSGGEFPQVSSSKFPHESNLSIPSNIESVLSDDEFHEVCPCSEDCEHPLATPKLGDRECISSSVAECSIRSDVEVPNLLEAVNSSVLVHGNVIVESEGIIEPFEHKEQMTDIVNKSNENHSSYSSGNSKIDLSEDYNYTPKVKCERVSDDLQTNLPGFAQIDEIEDQNRCSTHINNSEEINCSCENDEELTIGNLSKSNEDDKSNVETISTDSESSVEENVVSEKDGSCNVTSKISLEDDHLHESKLFRNAAKSKSENEDNIIMIENSFKSEFGLTHEANLEPETSESTAVEFSGQKMRNVCEIDNHRETEKRNEVS